MDNTRILVAVTRGDMFLCTYGPDILAIIIVCIVVLIVYARHERR